MTSLDGVITLKDPSTVLAGKVILKVEKINVQVTLQDSLIERRSHLSFTSISSVRKCFFTNRLNLSLVNFHNTFY